MSKFQTMSFTKKYSNRFIFDWVIGQQRHGQWFRTSLTIESSKSTVNQSITLNIGTQWTRWTKNIIREILAAQSSRHLV